MKKSLNNVGRVLMYMMHPKSPKHLLSRIPYEEWEYEYESCLHAVMRRALYIESENEGKFYRVPIELRDVFAGFGLSSNVGRITMNGKIFLAFDDILWYIPKNKFKKYGITEVERIE